MNVSSQMVHRTLYVLLAACVALVAISTPYGMSADVVSYLDLSDLIRQHQWHWLVNAYWHPGYPALLFLARIPTGMSVWKELEAARILNILITGLLFLAVRFLLSSAILLRTSLQSGREDTQTFEPIRRDTLGILAAAITFIVVTRDLTPAAILPDTSLAVLILCGAAFLLRVSAKKDLMSYAGVGLCFGVAFLIKSVAFPLFLVSFVLLFLIADSLKKAAVGSLVTALIFAALAGPYIGALSNQKGRFTTGDSGGLNYAWYVDGADRFEQQKNDPSRYGAAKGDLKHTSTEILANPPVYDYGTAMPATEPQWFDPSYWNDGLKPHFNLKAQLKECRSNLFVLVQYFALRPQYFVLFLMLLLLGARWRAKSFGRRGLGPVLLLVLAQLGMYFLVLTEPRYIGSAILVVLIASLAFLRIPKRGALPEVLATSVVLFLAMLLCLSFTDSLQNLKKNKQAGGHAAGAYSKATFTAAESLSEAGIRPGDSVACLGEVACRGDLYWARLARVHIRTEIFADTDPPLDVWEKANKGKVEATMQSTDIKAIVADFGPDITPPSGWKRLGEGEFFVFYP